MRPRLGAPTRAQLDQLLAAATRADVTYGHVGSTLRADSAPAASVDLGTGTLDAARDGLRAWACHGGIGATVHPADAPIAVGTTVLVVLRLGPERLVVPNRIVAVVDEPARFGFAYGTLPGHAERGEESFVVERDTDGRVTAAVRVEATGGGLLRLADPVTRRVQRLAARRYLAALRRYVEGVRHEDS